MTALPADIAAGTRAATVGDWIEAAIKAKYPGAREQYSPPAEGFFDSAADADAAAEQRGELLGVERRRFAVSMSDLIWIDPVDGLPTMRLVDQGQAVDMPAIVARYELNLETETTSVEMFG